MKPILTGLLVIALVGQTTPSSAAEGSTAAQVGYGVGSAVGTLVYVPLKATFCILGGIGAAFTAIASPPTAGKVARVSCGGTWVVTPDVVSGDEPMHFVGEPQAARHVDTSAVASR